MIKIRNLAPVVAIGALVGLAGCSGGATHQAAAMPPAAPPPAPAAAPAPPPPPPMTPYEAEHAHGTVRAVQTALQQQGLYRGKVDGEWGPLTKRAVRRYQRQNNLPTTGTLDQATLASMNITARGGASSMNSGAGSDAPAMPGAGAGTATPGASSSATPPKTGY
jgi:peptidoglycan hydrolase-like protein with peptidoglycan-binding domain